LLARLQELDTSPGVRVVKVRKGSSAEKAGVVEGDVIIEYAGETGFRASGFKRLVEDYAGAKKVTLSLVNNEVITTMLVAGGELGVAIEDIKRPPRPRRPPPQQQQSRERPRERASRR
jgi:S1-C subfamily serine protease